MASISFKDVGVRGFKSNDVLVKNRSLLPIGIKTPINYDASGNGLLEMHTDIKEQIADNFRNLILTNWGDRLGNYHFGANLKPLMVDFSHKDDFDSEAMIRINTAISKWMPFIIPVAYESYFDHINNVSTAINKLVIVYSVPGINLIEQKIEVSLFGI